MVKQLLKIIFCAFVLFVPVNGMASSDMTMDESCAVKTDAVRISVKGKSVRVQHAEGLTLEIYSVTGAKVAVVNIESADQTLRLNLSRGCYIIKVGEVARKVSIL